jgi:hypothetical protein
MALMGSRLCSLFLLLIFVGGGFGVPDADALLFHTIAPASRPDAAHFDVPGGCGAHSERCALTTAASAPQLGEVGLGAVRVAPDAFPRPVFTPVPSLRSANRGLFPLSRAPPAPAC